MLRFEDFSNEKNEIKEAPVKPKEKETEKEKQQPQKPSVDPFKRRPMVKPGEEPAPKASLMLENKISSKEGMAYVTYKKTDDEMGYEIHFSISGCVLEGEAPKDWKKELQEALNEAEESIMKKLSWLK